MNFKELNIDERIIKSLEERNIMTLTPIQEKTLPLLLDGNDLIGLAPTGTGKTIAYSLPIIEKISKHDLGMALIILPTRELAMQVAESIRLTCKYMQNISCALLYGGQNIDYQIKDLKRNPNIIVGTPGRILDHLKRKTLKLTNLTTVVLDEADEMLDMGFIEDIDAILEYAKEDVRFMFFSATFPEEIKKLTSKYMNNPMFVQVQIDNTALPKIDQYFVELLERNKIDCLSRMLDIYNFNQVLIFCRTKKNVDDLSLHLVDRGYKVDSLHGDMRQEARTKVMNMFKQGIIRVLIATDIAARGLDIGGIDAVINYDIPDDVEYYVHRIGRTARAGRSGKAYTFVNRKELRRLHDFETSLKIKINEMEPPSYDEARLAKANNLLFGLLDKDIPTYEDYKNAIDAFLFSNDYLSLEDVAVALLSKALHLDSVFSDSKEDLKVKKGKKEKTSTKKEQSSQDKGKNTKRKKVDGFTRMFINLGLVDDLKKEDLLDLLKKGRHVNKNEVINMDILSTYSFFDIPDKQVNVMLDMLNNQTYSSRKIVCEIAGSREKGEGVKDYQKVKKNKDKSREKKDFKEKRPKLKVEPKKSKERKKITKKRIDISW